MTFDDCTLMMGSTDVSAAYIGTTLVYSGGTQPIDYSTHYLTFVAQEDGTFNNTGSSTLEYSVDDGANWTTLSANTNTPTVLSGNSILWKGTYQSNSVKFSSTGRFYAEGNIMSLLYGDNFTSAYSITNNYQFGELFYGCTGLTSAENLILPATTLANGCYQYMFRNCTSLTAAPELPATSLTNNCYSSMFRGCASLTTAPELPATSLQSGCYSYMFDSCTSLTTAPELPATTLAGTCYSSMFRGCASLNYVKCLATSDINQNNSTGSWLSNVSANGTFVKDQNATWPTGSSGIPTGWTVQDAT